MICNEQYANEPIIFGWKVVAKRGMLKITGSRRNERF
jgi:hypothetical protein